MPRDYLSIVEVEAGHDASAGYTTESLGQQRALPDWGYDHGYAFDKLPASHPLWLETSIEEFTHALFYSREWRFADRAVRRVMDVVGVPLTSTPSTDGLGSDKAATECATTLAKTEGSSQSGCAAGNPIMCDASEDERSPPMGVHSVLCAYASRHKLMVRSAAAVPLGTQRYLVAEAGNWGMGNRLYALVSCLALALATNRTLLLRDWFLFPSRLPQVHCHGGGLWACVGRWCVGCR